MPLTPTHRPGLFRAPDTAGALPPFLQCAVDVYTAQQGLMNQLVQQDQHQGELQGVDRFRLLVESVRDYAIFMLDPTATC